MELCETHQLVFWVGFMKAFEGWTLAEQGRDEEAIDTIREGLAASDKTSTLMFKPHSYALLAQVHAGCGRIDESLHLIDEALTIVGDTSEHWITPELHRLKGETLRLCGDGTARADEAEACFRRALTDARERSAKSWELRAATSLAGLWRDLDRRQAAIDLLMPVYEWFTEGFDTADLKDAKQLLEELG